MIGHDVMATIGADFRIVQLPAFNDNYLYLVCDVPNRRAAAIDPGDAQPILDFLSASQFNLSHILLTHHHGDHIGGCKTLKQAFPSALVCGFAEDQSRLPKLDTALYENDILNVGSLSFHVWHTPGHTLGHICYYEPQIPALFCGDTLFSLGCGRLFEGDAPMMYHSLAKLNQLSDTTMIYCAHEYTANNLEFSLSILPQDPALNEQKKRIEDLRAQGRATVPTTWGQERSSNLFLRCQDPYVQRTLGIFDQDPIATFSSLRKAKDHF